MEPPTPSRAERAHPDPAAPLGRRARRQAETRARILRAALDLFARQGFFATTIEQITEAADVGKGTFFNYFPTKEHVLAGFAEGQLDCVQRALAAARQAAAPSRQVLHRLFLALAAQPGRSPSLVRGLLAANLSSDAVLQVMRRNLARGRRLLARLVVRGQQRGEVRRDREPLEVARLFQQTFLGTMLLWALHPSLPLEDSLAAAFDVFWSGISARRAAEGRATFSRGGKGERK
jgi:AcrR family transcriptional regulator